MIQFRKGFYTALEMIADEEKTASSPDIAHAATRAVASKFPSALLRLLD